jgi:hypothetical protein
MSQIVVTFRGGCYARCTVSETSLETGQQIEQKVICHISGFSSLAGRNHRTRIGSVWPASIAPQAIANDLRGGAFPAEKPSHIFASCNSVAD